MRNVYELRRKIGMVAPLPVGLPLSIYDNVAFAPRAAGFATRATSTDSWRNVFGQAALWDEVKDRLDSLGTKLSGGQQQRLTIARALSHRRKFCASMNSASRSIRSRRCASRMCSKN